MPTIQECFQIVAVVRTVPSCRQVPRRSRSVSRDPLNPGIWTASIIDQVLARLSEACTAIQGQQQHTSVLLRHQRRTAGCLHRARAGCPTSMTVRFCVPLCPHTPAQPARHTTAWPQHSTPPHAGEFSTYYFGANHPMKPHRLTMTNHLVLGYELHKHMDMFVSACAGVQRQTSSCSCCGVVG